MLAAAAYVELLVLVFYCSGKEKGIHRDELSQHLKVPVEKILYSLSLSHHIQLCMQEWLLLILILDFTFLFQGSNQVSWRGRLNIFHDWWVSLQVSSIWLSICHEFWLCAAMVGNESNLNECCYVYFSFNIFLCPFGWV